MFYPLSNISETTLAYLPPFRKSNYLVYWIMILMVVTAIMILPFVNTNIAVRSMGITRPLNERTEIKPVIGGIIDTLYYHEGSHIAKGAVLLRLKDQVTGSKRRRNDYEISQRQQFVHDLELLTSSTDLDESLTIQLQSPLYREQLSRFIQQLADQEAGLKKSVRELSINRQLLADKVIAPKEYFDVEVQNNRVSAGYKAFMREQQATWQQDLSRYRLELSQYQDVQVQVKTDASYYEVKTPVAGIIQGINDKYAGGLVQAGETLCILSPDDTLLAECYVSPRDIGLIQKGQLVHFQVDAFDYNYFGVLTGKVRTIDNDFTTVNNEPVFKVRCTFDKSQLSLKNGFTGRLQKGLTFQARFIIGHRSLWQLLWDKLDNWLNPSAPKTTIQHYGNEKEN